MLISFIWGPALDALQSPTPSPFLQPGSPQAWFGLREAIAGAVGGLAVFVVERVWSYWSERRKARKPIIVKSTNINRRVTGDIFLELAPGRTVESVKELLGVPTKYAKRDHDVFSESEVTTHSYLYLLKNAFIKITSKDNETIDTITVISGDGSITTQHLLMAEDSNHKALGKLKVWPSLVDGPRQHTYFKGRLDSSFAVQTSSGPPQHLVYTFFGYSEKADQYLKSKEPELFLDSEITGVCISSDSKESYYIWDYELT